MAHSAVSGWPTLPPTMRIAPWKWPASYSVTAVKQRRATTGVQPTDDPWRMDPELNTLVRPTSMNRTT